MIIPSGRPGIGDPYQRLMDWHKRRPEPAEDVSP
jgi:hypothetical protein